MSSNKTPVTVLQEHLLKRNETASYHLIYNGVGTHEPLFKYEVTAGGQTAIGSGKSKKEAKHEAARIILQKLINEGEDFTDLVEDTTSIASPYAEVLKENAVGALQDFCAENNLPGPKYEQTRDEGLPHAKVFCVKCSVSSLSKQWTARTKKQAKQFAAKSMLDELRIYLGDIIPIGDVISSKDMLDGPCNEAINKLQESGIKKLEPTAPFGLNIADYINIFNDENFTRSSTLDEIKGRSSEWFENHEDPEELFQTILSELNLRMESGKFECDESNVVNIWLTLNSSPQWSFYGSGSNQTIAYTKAIIGALQFLAMMSS